MLDDVDDGDDGDAVDDDGIEGADGSDTDGFKSTADDAAPRAAEETSQATSGPDRRDASVNHSGRPRRASSASELAR